tara:strand:- start:241 stop:582 length:342 start_codon:yes stop_codon:yes gene_type:complete
MRVGFKNAIQSLRKFGKNAKSNLQSIGQKINDNKKMISLVAGLVTTLAGITGGTGMYYDTKGKRIQRDIDEMNYINSFPSVPTTINQHNKKEEPRFELTPPPKRKIPTDIWNN